NGRVMWEDFLSAAPVSLLLTPEAGANELEITPWNGPLLLSGIEVEILDGTASAPPDKKPTPARKASPLGRTGKSS
ncbi:MAG: hypothetical protein NTZ26_12775, partial [Candidatus Aminicenantes bacterium]|nr:hypothetical protein [Candidatus Aminicenantes bacterium]